VVSTSTVFFYTDTNLRASDDAVQDTDALHATNTYRGDKHTAVYSDKVDIKSRTHFFGPKGEEVAEFSQTFTSTGAVKETTINTYDGEALNFTTTYLGGIEDSKVITGLAKKSYTDFVGNVQGEEIADFQLNYKGTAGNEVVSTSTVFFYTDTNLRASDDAVQDTDALHATNTYRGDKHTAVYSDKVDIKSRTHFFGPKGEEVAEFSQTFTSTGAVKETTINTYDGEALNFTTTYLGGIEDSKVITGLAKKSYTDFVGNVQGEEIADFQLNYKGTAGNEVVSTSTVFFYTDTNLRASDDAVQDTDALHATNTYRGDKHTAVYSDKVDIKSRTHFFGPKGEEVAEFSQTFTSTGAVKETTINTYDGEALNFTTTYLGGIEDSKVITGLAKKSYTDF